jgi:transglutaminase-like putative cysteine protease
MLLQIQHETKLSYSSPVSETVFEVRMAPASDEDQTNLGYRLRITPASHMTAYRDAFRNRVDLFNIQAPYRELSVRASAIARTHRRSAEARLAGAPWPLPEPAAVEALEFVQSSPLVDRSTALSEFLTGLHIPPCPMLSLVERLMAAVRERMKYEKKVTTAWTPLSRALELGRGVCQDFAHLFLGTCRGIGLPARYVSGYVHGPGELATHAWCQVWAGRGGWVDVDPTYGRLVADEHVVTAVGRDFSDVPPNKGVWKGQADETISVTVKAEPIDRVPPEWNDWGSQAPWAGGIWSHFQRQPKTSERSLRTAYKQQQSQQQQGGSPSQARRTMMSRPRGPQA